MRSGIAFGLAVLRKYPLPMGASAKSRSTWRLPPLSA